MWLTVQESIRTKIKTTGVDPVVLFFFNWPVLRNYFPKLKPRDPDLDREEALAVVFALETAEE